MDAVSKVSAIASGIGDRFARFWDSLSITDATPGTIAFVAVMLGTTFFDTLLDENAASHIALGESYAFTAGEEARIQTLLRERGETVTVNEVRAQQARDAGQPAVHRGQHLRRRDGGHHPVVDVAAPAMLESVPKQSLLRPPRHLPRE